MILLSVVSVCAAPSWFALWLLVSKGLSSQRQQGNIADLLGWEDKPANFRQSYFPFWWYANVTDENGRGFPR
jgi:hypothetical protein